GPDKLVVRVLENYRKTSPDVLKILLRQNLAVYSDFAFIAFQHPHQKFHQRTLPRAVVADHRSPFTPPEFQGDMIQCIIIFCSVTECDTVEFNHISHHLNLCNKKARTLRSESRDHSCIACRVR